MTDNEKHSNLLMYRLNYCCKKFFTKGLFAKLGFYRFSNFILFVSPFMYLSLYVPLSLCTTFLVYLPLYVPLFPFSTLFMYLHNLFIANLQHSTQTDRSSQAFFRLMFKMYLSLYVPFSLCTSPFSFLYSFSS